jgi:UDPglucose 6-dehydrogenase
MRVTIIGAGYVGLVTGACLAETGNTVMCVDKDVGKIALLKSGKIPFHEPGLAPLVEGNISRGRLIFSNDLRSAVRHAPVIFLAVGTPRVQTAKRIYRPWRRRPASSGRTWIVTR